MCISHQPETLLPVSLSTSTLMWHAAIFSVPFYVNILCEVCTFLWGGITWISVQWLQSRNRDLGCMACYGAFHTPLAKFTKEVNPSLAKTPYGGLSKLVLTSLVKLAVGLPSCPTAKCGYQMLCQTGQQWRRQPELEDTPIKHLLTPHNTSLKGFNYCLQYCMIMTMLWYANDRIWT